MSRPVFANSPPTTKTNDDHGFISIASTWRSVRTESSAATVQTVPVALSSSACGPEPPVSIECQTTDDLAGSRPIGSAAAARSAELSVSTSRGKLFDVIELATFVQRVEGPLSEMLMENLQSSAFDDWPLVNPLASLSQDDDNAISNQVGLLALSDTLVADPQSTSPSSANGLSLVAADRSKSGSSLILAYAHPHDTANSPDSSSPWCTHTAHVSVILNSQKQRTAHWHVNACPTTLTTHPDLTNLVAVGTWPGDVFVWDSNAVDSTAAVATVAAGLAYCGHADAVAQVVWVPSSADTGSMGMPPSASAKGVAGGLWSAGTDGSVIEWQYMPALAASLAANGKGGKDFVARLEPVRRCTVGVPATRNSNGGGGLGMPLRSLAIHADPVVGATMVLLGSDAGHVVHLDARRMRPVADSAPADAGSAAMAAVMGPHFKYASHAGAVNAIVINPHVSSLFATVGQDGNVLIHRLFKDTPLLRIQPPSPSPNAPPPLSAAWFPSRPGLLAVNSIDSLFLVSVCGSDSGAVIAHLALPCTGPLLFHPTLPLLYVGVVEQSGSGMRVVKLAANALKLGDMEVRMKEVVELNRLVGGDGGADEGDDGY